MENLIIRLKIPSVILTTSTPLDGVLSGILYERREPIDRVLDVDMIARRDGVPMASVAMFPHGYSVRGHTFVRNIRHDFMKDRTLYEKIDAFSKPSVFHKHGPFSGDGEHAALMNQYEIILPEMRDGYHMEYRCRGDRDQIVHLLNCAGYIGAGRNKGMGQIDDIMVEEGDRDDPYWGIIHDGALVRPVPSGFLPEGISGTRHFHGRYAVPYNPALALRHNHEMTEIVVPHNPDTMVAY